MLKAYLGDRAKYAYQYEQLGTGHAVMQGIESIKDVDGTVMVLYGDSPLIEAETLKRVREDHSKKDESRYSNHCDSRRAVWIWKNSQRKR